MAEGTPQEILDKVPHAFRGARRHWLWSTLNPGCFQNSRNRGIGDDLLANLTLGSAESAQQAAFEVGFGGFPADAHKTEKSVCRYLVGQLQGQDLQQSPQQRDGLEVFQSIAPSSLERCMAVAARLECC